MAFQLTGSSGVKYEFTHSARLFQELPNVPGVYAYYRGGGPVSYIGQTNDLGRRHQEHLSDSDPCVRDHSDYVGYYIRGYNESLLRSDERDLIAGVRPICQNDR